MPNQPRQDFKYSNLPTFIGRRIQKGFTVDALRRAAGVSNHVIERLEKTGECHPKKFNKLCARLGLDPAFFLPDDLKSAAHEDALAQQ